MVSRNEMILSSEMGVNWEVVENWVLKAGDVRYCINKIPCSIS